MRLSIATLISLFAVALPAAEIGTPPRPSEQLAPFPPRGGAQPPLLVELPPPQVAHVRPAEKAEPALVVPAVVVSFNQPMATSGVALRLEPSPPGQLRWIDPSTFAFEPAAGRLPLGTRFTAEVPAGLKTAAGTSLAEGKRWTFETARPALVNTSPLVQKYFDPRAPIGLRFNAEMDPAEVARAATVTVGGERVEFHVALDKSGLVELRPERSLPFAADCELVLSASLRSTEGPLPLGADIRLRFRTPDPLRVTETRISGYGYDGTGPLEVHFNNPLPPQKLAALVHVEPPATSMRAGTDGLKLSGAWSGAPSIRVRIEAGLRDVYGQALAQPHVATVTLGRAHEKEGLADAVGLVDAAGPMLIKGFGANRTSARFRTAAVASSQLSAALAYALRDRGAWQDFAGGADLGIVLDAELDKQEIALPLAGPGLWLTELELSPTSLRDSERSAQVVQVTSLGLTTAVDDREIIAAVGTLRDNRPVAQARFLLYDEFGKLLAEARGNDLGIARLPSPRALRAPSPLVLVAESGAERCFDVLDDYSYRPWTTAPNEGSWNYLGGLWTERGVYRPGETIHAYALLRDRLPRGDFQKSSGKVHWKAESHGHQKMLVEGDAVVSAAGIASFEVPVPIGGKLGSLYLRLGNDGPTAHVVVLEARVPESRLTAVFRDEPHLIGGVAHAEFSGETYSGAPLAGARVGWTVTAYRATSRLVEARKDYHFSLSPKGARPDRGKRYERRGEASLDADGHLSLAVPLSRECAEEGSCEFYIEAEAVDALQHGVSAGHRVYAHDLPFMVGLKSNWESTPAGRRLVVQAAVTDTQEKAHPLPVEVAVFARRELADPGAGPEEEEVELARALAPASFDVPRDEQLPMARWRAVTSKCTRQVRCPTSSA